MAYPIKEPMKYQEAVLTLNGGKSRKLAHNTYLKRRDGLDIAVQYHETDIILYHSSGRITLNTGGWRTLTTKERFSWFLPYGWQVTQENSVWYISQNQYLREAAGAQAFEGTFYFEDGIQIAENGLLTGAARYDKEREKETRKLKRRAKAFSTDYMKAFQDGKVEKPSKGDCWGCLMVSKDGKAVMGGADHVLNHIEQKYYVPSLLVRACEKYPVSPMAKNTRALMWADNVTKEQRQEEVGNSFYKYGFEQLEKSLYKYLKAELGLAA